VGIVGKLASALGVGASVGGAGAAVGGVGAAVAGGGATAAVTSFAGALTTVIAPLTAVIGLGYAAIKVLDRIGALSEAKGAVQQLGAIAKFGIVQAGSKVTGRAINYQALESKVMSGVPMSSGGGGGGGVTVNVNAPNVVGTQKELAAALKPAIYQASRELGLA